MTTEMAKSGSRGKPVLLPEQFLRTRTQIISLRRQRDETPKLVDSLRRRKLVENVEEAARTNHLFGEFRRRCRLHAASSQMPTLATASDGSYGSTLETPPSSPYLGASRSLLCARVVRTIETSYWDMPACHIWVQDLGSGEQWTVVRSLAQVKDLSSQIQDIENAARDDEIAEATLAAASSGGEDLNDESTERNAKYEVDADEGRWKLDDVEYPNATREEKKRKGHLLNYLSGKLETGATPSIATDEEGKIPIRKSEDGDESGRSRDVSSESENDNYEGFDDDTGEYSGGSDDSESATFKQDFDDFNENAEGLSISFDDSHFLVGSPVGAAGSGGTGLLSPRGAKESMLSSWRSQLPMEAQEQTDRLLRRVVLANSFFDPTVRLKPFVPSTLPTAAEAVPVASRSLLEQHGKKDDAKQAPVKRRERRAAIRRRARRKKRIAAQAAASLAAWIGGPPLTNPATTSSPSETVPFGVAPVPAGIKDEVDESDNGGGFLFNATSSLSSTLAMTLPLGLSSSDGEAPMPQSPPTVEAKASPAKASQDDLIRELRVYTMAVLSLPPLARLVEAYLNMAAKELDTITGNASTTANKGAAVSAAGAVVSVGAGDTVANSVHSAATSLVMSLFGSFMAPSPELVAPTLHRLPPPLPPPPPPTAEDSVHIKNYWDSDDEEDEDTDNEGEQGASSSTSYKVVARKAKVREGIEIKHSGSPASSAVLVGTLGEGTVVVVLEEAVATDGTLRSKVRTVLDFDQGVQMASRQMVVGWVTSKLLSPHQLARSGPPAEGQSLHPVPPTLSSTSSSHGLTLSRGDEHEDEEHLHQARLGIFSGTHVVGPEGSEKQLDPDEQPRLGEINTNNDGIEVDRGDKDEVEYECGGGPVHGLMERLAVFLAQTVYLIKEACEADLYAIVARHSSQPLGTEEAEGLVDGGVWRQVEAEVVVPLSARLSAAIAREVSSEAQRTAKRLRALKALPQEFWSIPDKLMSPTSWAEAVEVLNAIPRATLPSDKVDLLLLAVQTIERLSEDEPAAKIEAQVKIKGSAKPLGADDLFPIFVYVLVQSDLWKQGAMVCLRELLSGLANPERQRWSASAYYVATLEAAIEHIKAT